MWFLVLRRPLRPRSEWRYHGDEHLTWMKQQHDAGKIYLSGPSKEQDPATDSRKYGIYLIRAASREEADAIAASDPYTAAGDCTYELIEWDIHQILGVGPFTAAGATWREGSGGTRA